MLRKNYFFILTILLVVVFLNKGDILLAQEYDILIKNAHLIDPKNDIDQKMDVAIADGKIAEVSSKISESNAKTTIDATGLYITPGIIDMHAHLFWGTEDGAYISNSYASLPPDGFTFRTGVTTVVDAGSAGWRNFKYSRSKP